MEARTVGSSSLGNEKARGMEGTLAVRRSREDNEIEIVTEGMLAGSSSSSGKENEIEIVREAMPHGRRLGEENKSEIVTEVRTAGRRSGKEIVTEMTTDGSSLGKEKSNGMAVYYRPPISKSPANYDVRITQPTFQGKTRQIYGGRGIIEMWLLKQEVERRLHRSMAP